MEENAKEASPKIGQSKEAVKEKNSTLTESLRKNPWILSTFVLIVMAVVILFASIGGFSGSLTGNAISANDAGNILLNAFESQGATGISVDSVEEMSGVYQVNFLYQGQISPAFITKDGKFLVDLTPLPDSDVNAGSDSGGGYSGTVSASADDDAVLGDANAPITIIEFSDYQCPFCAKFWSETLPLIKKNYIDTGKVKLVFRDFPLTNIHPMAQPAAEAAECVRKVAGSDEAYFKYHDKLFENQNSLSESNLKTWAKQQGQNIDSCLDSGEFTDEVLADMADGSAAGVTGTPGFVINGILVSGAQPYSVFEQIIEGELANGA
ncbi:MAG: thioredoxin domain-containing protein [Candidatus Pacearchaeota archaeon]